MRGAREFDPDAVVLDMMLPDFDGLEVLRRMRADNANVPVLFLTAKDAVEDRVSGLTAGGDDYVTKPFSLEEVVARVRALMRRTTVAVSSSDSMCFLENSKHEKKMTLTRHERPIDTPRPRYMRLLNHSILGAGSTFSPRENISELRW